MIGNGPISAAEGAWFFVARNARRNLEVASFDGANSLCILSSRSSGLRDIGTAWAPAGEVSYSEYHFDGKKYKLWKSSISEHPTD